jgi:sulfur-oxidizing protein SoxX
MKQFIAVSAALALGIGTAVAQEVVPTSVSFVDGAVSGSLTGVAGDPANGIVIMDRGAGNCIACHQVTALEELPFHGNVGPSLDGVADRWSEEELRGIVANAKEMFPDSVMPSFYRTEDFIRPGKDFTGKAVDGPVQPLLTAQQVEDVVAFLLTLKEE